MIVLATSATLKEAKRKHKLLASALDPAVGRSLTILAIGNWKDEKGEIVFTRTPGLKIKKIGRRFALANVDGAATRIEPHSGAEIVIALL